MKLNIEQQLKVEKGRVRGLEESLEFEINHRKALERMLLLTIEKESYERSRDLRYQEEQLQQDYADNLA